MIADSVDIFSPNVSFGATDETILRPYETIFRFRRRSPETTGGYYPDNKRRPCPRPIAGDDQMRTTSFILAFAFMMAGPSMAGSSDQNLPGVGTFTYQGSPVATAASPIVLAAK